MGLHPTESDTDAEPICLRELADAPFRPTWAEVTANAETTCITTSRCEPDTEAALAMGRDDCEGSPRGC